MKKILIVSVLLVLMSSMAHAKQPIRLEKRSAVGLDLTWNGLAGMGALVTYHLTEQLSTDLGVGLSMVGTKTGVRLRYNFNTDSFEEISQQIRWGDIGVLPFVDGTSPRRTTLLSLLKMGIPAISPPPYKKPFKDEDFPEWSIVESLTDVKKRYLYWAKKQNKIIKIFNWENVVKEHLSFYES